MGTLVWTLAGVYPAMSGQTRRLPVVRYRQDAKRLGLKTYIGESLVAAMLLAHMGLLASVGADVHSQCASLDEALATLRSIALIWSFVCVNAIVSLQV